MISDRLLALLRDLASRCRAAGIQIDEVSAGATPPARYSIQQDGFTEFRPGNYVYFDRTQVGLGAATFDDCALTVMATVVSRPADDRIILDCGSKTLTSDGARGFSPLPGHGAIFRDLRMAPGQRPEANLVFERLSEEHATVRKTGGDTALQPGDRVRIIPNHSCVVSNLVDEVHFTEGAAIIETLRVAARGKIV